MSNQPPDHPASPALRQRLTSAWEQGARAARAGEPASTCPYPALMYDFVTWHNGWVMATHQMAVQADWEEL